jgi:transposase
LEDQRQDNGGLKIGEDYLQCLRDVLAYSPPEFDLSRPTWTREALALVLERETHVKVSLPTMSRALQTIGARLGRPKPMVRCPWSKYKRTRRLNQIRKLVEAPAQGEVVLYEDEVDIHLNPKIGLDWMLCGHQREVVTPGKNQKRYIAGAWDPIRKEMTWVESSRKRSLLFIDLCQKLVHGYPSAKKIHLIVDNYVIHTSQITQRALEALDGRIVLHFLPPYCPDYNQIEARWRVLHAQVTRNHNHKTMGRLMEAVRGHLRPFERGIARKKRAA